MVMMMKLNTVVVMHVNCSAGGGNCVISNSLKMVMVMVMKILMVGMLMVMMMMMVVIGLIFRQGIPHTSQSEETRVWQRRLQQL